MTVLDENPHDGNFILSEDDEGRCRATTSLSPQEPANLQPGTVLGKLTASGKFVPSPETAADGSETAVAVLVGSVDATSADVIAVAVTRHAEVNRYGLFYDATVDDDAKKSGKWDQLRAAGAIPWAVVSRLGSGFVRVGSWCGRRQGAVPGAAARDL
jgi:hypothetical protein